MQLDDTFYVVDLGVVAALAAGWAALLPRVHPFYAVKCNGDTALLATLAACGCSFDCASEAEIAAVTALGVAPDRIIFANACKRPSDIRCAPACSQPPLLPPLAALLTRRVLIFSSSDLLKVRHLPSSFHGCLCSIQFHTPNREPQSSSQPFCHDILGVWSADVPGRAAKQAGVVRTTADSVSELRKLAAGFPASEVLLRIRQDDPSARCQLGNKYGAEVDDIPGELKFTGRQSHIACNTQNPTHACIANLWNAWSLTHIKQRIAS